MKLLRNTLVFVSLLALEALLILLLPRIYSNARPLSFYMWIAFGIPLILVFLIFAWLVFKDDSRHGGSRLMKAIAGGLLFAVLWMSIVGITLIKITGSGTLLGIKDEAQRVERTFCP
ncbi:MAG: hypothetical protein A2X46_04460 [Lentisphaerae bacterium GWF2_57_35]|nr:MAG: hypothetical protein A2X46_04460 [Lentisphaerae bacterium GWF2_57_35]